MLKLLGSSANRSDYDLMSGVYKALAEHPEVDFRLLVSGAHLDPAFGKTLRFIHEDGLPILAQLETSEEADSKQGQGGEGGAGGCCNRPGNPSRTSAPTASWFPATERMRSR